MNNHTGLRVLVAEDDFYVAEEIKELVIQAGHTPCAKARNGTEAVKLALEHRPDIILMDIKMPQENGLEASARIQSECPTPIVILTAYDDYELVSQAVSSGASGYLLKPAKPSEINQALTIAVARFSELMKYRKQYQQLAQQLNAIKQINDPTTEPAQNHESIGFLEYLQQVRKYESLYRFAGSIAHSFNNILHVIIANAAMALEATNPCDPKHEFLMDVKNAATRAASISGHLLTFTGKNIATKTTHNLSQLVLSTIELLGDTSAQNISIKTQLDWNLPNIAANQSMLCQMITNILANAVEAMTNSQGMVFIKTGQQVCTAEDLSVPYLRNDLDPGTYAYLEMTDHGSGMTPASVQQIFDPFYSTKFLGRGLGMATVLGIVNNHRGSVKVWSQLGYGTTVRVWFPVLSDQEEKRIAPEPPSDESSIKQNIRILMVDDERSVLRVIRQYLSRSGFTVFISDNGTEAVTLFEQHKDELDCVLLDIAMPEMDGFEVFEQIHAIQPTVPVIFTSGYQFEALSDQMSTHPVAGFIEKPFALEKLKSTIKRILKQKQQENA